MSFLFNDQILSQLLADSGVAKELLKKAQQLEVEAKRIASDLANKLLSYQKTVINKPEADIYVRDLVNLVAYLNFLLRTNQRADDGKPLVIHQTFAGQPTKEFLDSIDPKVYVQAAQDFWVHKSGLLDNLSKLDIAAQQAGNEVMKPLVKNLISEVNALVDIKYTSIGDQKIPPAPSDQASKNILQVPFAADESTLEGQKTKQLTDEEKKALNDSIEQLRNTLPFQSSQVISPYDMDLFARNVYTILDKNPKLAVGPMLGQIQQFATDMDKNYSGWQTFISQISSQSAKNNISTLRDEVPYDRGGRADSLLEQMFNGHTNAVEAAQRLNQMIALSKQILLSIERSPQFVNLLGQEIIARQTREAQAFIDALNSLARSSE